MKDKDKNERGGAWRTLLRRLAWLIAVFALLALAGLALTSCGTARKVEYVEVPRITTDTVRLVSLLERTDTVRDSIYVDRVTELRGDTVLVTETKYKAAIRYRDRIVRDTVFRARVDTVSVPVTVTQEVERDLTTWQRILLALGRALLATMFAFAALTGWKVWRKWKGR